MIDTVIKGIPLKFNTSPDLFSPKSIDRGTISMLEHADISDGMKILDLGCGYGIVGIYAAKLTRPENVFMTDSDPKAVLVSKENAALNNTGGVTVISSDGFKNLNETGFDMILSNPPYHADFKAPKEFIEKGFNRLKISGKFLMVTKRRDWYKNKISAIFGGVSVIEENGYFVFVSEKRRYNYFNA